MKKIKLALLTVALAGSTLAMAQDKSALIKQFIDLQKPGIESLARGLVEQSSAPIAQAGSQYLQTQVPAEKREAAAKAADAELKKYFDEAYPIVRDKAVQLAPGALTPIMEQIAGRKLAPTYDYFRLYRDGDLCHVHRDRPACEHSMSLTLAYSDDKPWPLELGKQGADGPQDIISEDFGSEPMASLAMQVGDAVAYQGVDFRHGRTLPNPNRWSAHLFLHWIDPDGPHSDQAFDGKDLKIPVDFTFA